VKFYSAAGAVLIASGAVASALAQASGATAQSTNYTSESTMISMPASPKELLVNIQSALKKGELLNDAFYSDSGLHDFLGAGYRFARADESAGQKTIYFDDGGNVYVDEKGNLTPLGRNRPCLRSGTILFEAGGPSRRARASISIITAGQIPSNSTFNANLVLEVFGHPGSVTEGVPSVPPPHGREYVATLPTSELGNRWFAYDTELDGHLQRVKFRTLGDGTVIEIQISEEQR
jgi:hypothetical protein